MVCILCRCSTQTPSPIRAYCCTLDRAISFRISSYPDDQSRSLCVRLPPAALQTPRLHESCPDVLDRKQNRSTIPTYRDALAQLPFLSVESLAAFPRLRPYLRP